MSEDWQEGGFGLYIHWPFCQAKCPYCDFNSHVAQQIDQTRWAQAYVTEIERHAADVPGRVLNTVFFGGGTPSLMAPETVAAILEKIRAHWTLANDFEVTLEANPGSVDAGRFAGYADAGVNRVSLGVQALADEDLRRLGRVHSVADALQALDIANRNFDRVSFDLIYARQSQTPAAWRDELRQALSLASGHLSLYQLTIEPGTAFGDLYRRNRLRNLPGEDSAADMYQITQEICAGAGYDAYEISNHARPGHRARHNMIYWRYGDYIGIGPGAHGRLTIAAQRYATEMEKNPGKWLSDVEAGHARQMTPLSGRDQACEYVLMGLRIAEGLSISRFRRLSGQEFSPQALEFLQDIEMIEVLPDQIIATEAGRQVLNAVIEKLLEGIDDSTAAKP